MINFIENILSRFESCFSRKTAFGWFVILTTGLMLRSDKLGIISVIHTCWFRAVKEHAPLYKEGIFLYA